MRRRKPPEAPGKAETVTLPFNVKAIDRLTELIVDIVGSEAQEQGLAPREAVVALVNALHVVISAQEFSPILKTGKHVPRRTGYAV